MASAVIYYSTWKGEPLRRIENFRESLEKKKKRQISICERYEGRVAFEYRISIFKAYRGYQENLSLLIIHQIWKQHRETHRMIIKNIIIYLLLYIYIIIL